MEWVLLLGGVLLSRSLLDVGLASLDLVLLSSCNVELTTSLSLDLLLLSRSLLEVELLSSFDLESLPVLTRGVDRDLVDLVLLSSCEVE